MEKSQSQSSVPRNKREKKDEAKTNESKTFIQEKSGPCANRQRDVSINRKILLLGPVAAKVRLQADIDYREELIKHMIFF